MRPTATVRAYTVHPVPDCVVAEEEISAFDDLSVADPNCDPVSGVLQNSKFHLRVLKFEGFSDGRAFSQARLLRERYRFTGEIRARGEVLRDQLSFMQRCGFTEFELEDNTDIKLALSAFGDISHSYQPELE